MLYDIISLLVFTVALIISAIFAQDLSLIAKDALFLCSNTIIPSLFPFMIISQLLSRTGISLNAGKCLSFIISPMFGIPSELCGAFLTGLFGGFPNGAHSAGIIYSEGLCTKKQAERCIAISNNSSFPFLITVAGIHSLGCFKNGLFLVLSQFISLFIVSLIIRFTYPDKTNILEKLSARTIYQKKKLSVISCKCITETCINMLNVCGFITVFYIISNFIFKSVKLNNIVKSLSKGALEMSSGIISVSQIEFPLNFIICSVIVGFSGLSVIFQVTEAANRYGLSAKEFVFGRIANAIIMPLTSAFLLIILPGNTVTAFSSFTPGVYYSQIDIKTAVILYVLAFAIVMIFFAVMYTLASLIDKKVTYCKRKIN